MSQASPANRATGGATPLLSHPKDKSPERDMASFVLPESSRGSRILCCMALCLLGPGESQLRWDLSNPVFLTVVGVSTCLLGWSKLCLLPPQGQWLLESPSPQDTSSKAGGHAILKCYPTSGDKSGHSYHKARRHESRFLIQY